MVEFDSWRSYRLFEQSVKYKARHIFEDHVESFLEKVLATSVSRKRNLESGEVFLRAQLGFEWKEYVQGDETFEVEAPFSKDRMKPKLNSAREGRVNPKGIPCLYLATDGKTAMAEVRPWVGSYISVGRFQLQRNLTLVDCSVDIASGFIFHLDEPDLAERERSVWADINKAFSEPVSLDDSTAEYAPTQILAESFRKHGYDGVVYKSVLGDGSNLALFEIGAAELITCRLYEVKNLSFEFEASMTPFDEYYVR